MIQGLDVSWLFCLFCFYPSFYHSDIDITNLTHNISQLFIYLI